MKKLPPVDLSILKSFKFVKGNGSYPARQACIMSAGRLAVDIAAGKTTLDQALDPLLTPYPSDQIECVHELVRELCIEINDYAFENDSVEGDKARTKWALATLPRILGTTKGGKHTTKKIVKVSAQARSAYRWNKARKEAEAFLHTKDIEHLQIAREWMSEESDMPNEDYHQNLHFQLETILSALGH